MEAERALRIEGPCPTDVFAMVVLGNETGRQRGPELFAPDRVTVLVVSSITARAECLWPEVQTRWLHVRHKTRHFRRQR